MSKLNLKIRQLWYSEVIEEILKICIEELKQPMKIKNVNKSKSFKYNKKKKNH